MGTEEFIHSTHHQLPLITMLFSMFHTLGVFTTILSIAGVSVAMVVNRDAALNRRDVSAKCSGTPQELILNPGQDIVLRNEGFENGEFIEGCSTLYEVMEEMNLPCSSSSVWLLEDGEKPHNDQYCNEKTDETVFYSHEHLIDIKFKNKGRCLEAGGCAGTRVQVRISAECVCGGRYDQDNGVITSPLYPASYVNSEACIYDIVAPKRKQIALTCEYFNLSAKCESGLCGVQNGDRTYLQDITTFERYEGDELQGKTIKSKKNHHTFYFLSNSDDVENKKRKYGFSCSYKFV